MINSADFTKRLEKILDFYSLSATAFAEKIDFNRSTISHLLSGRNKPSLEFVMKLLEKFPEVEMQWLLFGKGSFPTLEEQKTFSKTTEQEKSNIFSDKNEFLQKSAPVFNSNTNEIERIVIFYKNGRFNVYEN